MNAKEALERSIASRARKYEEFLAMMDIAIERAVESGLFTTVLENAELPSERLQDIISHYESLGFTVSLTSYSIRLHWSKR